MGTVKLSIPYFRTTPSGYYWEPSIRLKRLGFTPQPLGKDLGRAVVQAKTLNAEAAAGQSGTDQKVRPGTVTWLIRQWQASPAWTALAEDTRQSYSMSFKAIEAWCGDYPPRSVT